MKTILLPFHDENAGRVALTTAFSMATRFASYLEGLLVREGPPISFGPGVAVPPQYLSEAARSWRRFADEAREHFIAASRENGMPLGELESTGEGPMVGWREIEGRETEVVGGYGRLFDLIVVGRATNDPSARWHETCEAALFESGRPVLIASPEPGPAPGRTIVIAWNGSTETARTVALGMPLLVGAEKVMVLTVEGGMVVGPSGRELATHLARHGINADAVTAKTAGRSVGEAMLAEAARIGADLLFKGAFTRNRLRQMIFGGATQHVLTHATIPVLMAH